MIQPLEAMTHPPPSMTHLSRVVTRTPPMTNLQPPNLPHAVNEEQASPLANAHSSGAPSTILTSGRASVSLASLPHLPPPKKARTASGQNLPGSIAAASVPAAVRSVTSGEPQASR